MFLYRSVKMASKKVKTDSEILVQKNWTFLQKTTFFSVFLRAEKPCFLHEQIGFNFQFME